MHWSLFLWLTLGSVCAISWNPDPERYKSLTARWDKFKAIPEAERTKERITGICGREIAFPEVNRNCGTKNGGIGRPSDSASADCDAACCHQGKLTGFCTGTLKGCKCTDDGRKALCGPDNPFLGIRCPDVSACRRKCCQQNFPNYNENARCGGFLKTKCKC